MSFDAVTKFEDKIGSYFAAPYAVATDCCTHAIELCLRYEQPYQGNFSYTHLHLCSISWT